MQPERRLVLDLDDQRGADHDRAGDHDDEDRRPIAGIHEGEVEPANLATRPQADEAGIDAALAATRAFAGNPAQRAFGQGGWRVGHVSPFLLPLWEYAALCNRLMRRGKPFVVSGWCPFAKARGRPLVRQSGARCWVAASRE